MTSFGRDNTVTKQAQPALQDFIDFAHVLADASGAAIRPYFRAPLDVSNKGPDGSFDPVTAADEAAEQVIAAAVAKRWPEHGFIGEEHGTTRPDARLRWVVDPIDGTRAFIMGWPMWGTLIGLMDGDAPVLGLMDQPFTRERFWSGSDAAYVRTADGERRIRTRSCARLADAILTTTHPDLFEPGSEAEAFARLKPLVRMTRYGGDCYAYCLLAAGFVDLVVEAGLKPYDVVALIPIIERAGGRITTWDGKPATAGGRVVAAGDARLHEQALAVLCR
ncbi:MAG: histidinol-phosphatase [Hyphomicrobium sp.]|nr:MAG: histidinol-phosphatase [Hyphomicrobium sp.]MBZ0209048.1 histidinol-phosphatase [Hyphomicrobium sp.]